MPDPPQPPAPPQPRQKGSGWWDPVSFGYNGGGMFQVMTGYDFASSTSAMFWDIGRPMSFTRASTVGASMFARSLLASSATVGRSFALVPQGNGFKLADPRAYENWARTAAKDAVSGSWEASGLSFDAVSNGADNYGVALYLQDNIFQSFSSAVRVTAFSGGGSSPIVQDPK